MWLNGRVRGTHGKQCNRLVWGPYVAILQSKRILSLETPRRIFLNPKYYLQVFF